MLLNIPESLLREFSDRIPVEEFSFSVLKTFSKKRLSFFIEIPDVVDRYSELTVSRIELLVFVSLSKSLLISDALW